MIFLINMVKSKIFYSFKFFYIRKQIQLYIIEFMKENGEIYIEIRTFTAFFFFFRVETLLEFDVFCIFVCCSV